MSLFSLDNNFIISVELEIWLANKSFYQYELVEIDEFHWNHELIQVE